MKSKKVPGFHTPTFATDELRIECISRVHEGGYKFFANGLETYIYIDPRKDGRCYEVSVKGEFDNVLLSPRMLVEDVSRAQRKALRTLLQASWGRASYPRKPRKFVHVLGINGYGYDDLIKDAIAKIGLNSQVLQGVIEAHANYYSVESRNPMHGADCCRKWTMILQSRKFGYTHYARIWQRSGIFAPEVGVFGSIGPGESFAEFRNALLTRVVRKARRSIFPIGKFHLQVIDLRKL